MRKLFGLCSGFLFLTFALGARADLLVEPLGNAGTNGNALTFGVFGNGAGSAITFQWDFSAAELSGLVGDTITGIGFRLQGGATTISTPTTVGTWDLELSGSLHALGSLDATPANNIAPGGVTVYDQSLVIPANSLVGGSGPNPFFIIDFTTPYTYAGGDLLMTVTEPGTAVIRIDANNVDANGNTTACFNGVCTTGFNYPITEFQFTPTVSAVPEPSSAWMLLTAAGLLVPLGMWRRAGNLKARPTSPIDQPGRAGGISSRLPGSFFKGCNSPLVLAGLQRFDKRFNQPPR